MSVKLAKRSQGLQSGPVRYRLEASAEGGPSALSIAVAYDQAPVPDHYYIADYYKIIPSDLEVLLIFGKLDHPTLDRLRNKVEIYFPASMFVRQLWRSSRDFEKTIASLVTAYKSSPVEESSISAGTDKVQTLHANNVLMVTSTGQCLLDFFYISAKDLWLRPPKGEPIGLEALVRIITSAPLLLGFLRRCDAVAKEYIERLGPELLNEERNDENLESDDI